MADDVYKKALEGLAGHSENERKEAVLALFKLKDRRAIDHLAKLCEMDRSAEVRTQARKAYYLLRDIHPNKLDEPFLELPDGISFDDLEKLLVDENPRIRSEAIKLAGKLDPQSTAPPLRRAIAVEKNPQLQARIILGLGRAGLKYDIPTIADFIPKADSNIQIAAIEALAMIGGADALEYVVPLLRDPDSNVRASATKALPPLEGGEMLNLLRGMAVSTNQAYRDAAVFSLQRFKAPLASRILGHIAAVDPSISLREKARAGLEAMAKSDENARKALELLNTPEEPEDPNAPVTVPLDGIWETTTPDPAITPSETSGVPGAPSSPDSSVAPVAPVAPPKPRVLVVPGVTKKLVKAICLGDQAQREDGLRQLSALLKPEHVPFLLLQLDREKDPRIVSHMLTLLGRTGVTQTYAAVVKRFKDVDNRVRANAIEAAMQLDPITTPDRIAGYLNDPNNRIRANVILASATRPNFDSLVWVRDLAAFGDPAYRRSALFVISRLQNPAFLEVLEILIYDDDMEVRHMAHKAIQEYAGRGVRKAKELLEVADRLMSKTTMPDQDFHAAMVAMRAPAAQRKPVRKQTKSATEELGEQLLGKDGVKAAGQSIKNLQDQAKVAREKLAAKLTLTKASITSTDSLEKIFRITKHLVLVIVLISHAITAYGQFNAESPFRLISLGAAVLAGVSGILLAILHRPGSGAILSLLLLLVPWTAVRFDFQDSDLIGGPRVIVPVKETGGHLASASASQTSSLATKRSPVRPASQTQSPNLPGGSTGKPPGESTTSSGDKARTGTARIRLLSPTKGSMIFGSFSVKAVVTGKPKSVEFLLDNTRLKVFDAKSEGTFEFNEGNSEKFPFGGHLLRAIVTDSAGHRSGDQVFVTFLNRLASITILSPSNGSVFWRDGNFLADVKGSSFNQVEFLLDDAVVCTFPADPAGLYEFPVPIATLSEGTHSFAVRTTMTDGRVASESGTFRVLVPKPAVSFVSPKNGDDVFGAVEVSFKVDSGWKETKIRILTLSADNFEKKVIASPPWQYSWETADLETGTHELKAVIENELDRKAEAVIKVNVIQPKLSAVFKGIRSGSVLTEDTRILVEVMSDRPGTTIEKVAVSLDDKQFKSLTTSPYSFEIKVAEILSGPRKLAAEAFRSDGQSFKIAPVTFSVNPSNRRNLFISARNATGKPLQYSHFEKCRLDVKEDGKNVSGLSIQSADSVPLQFGLLINVSASMKLDQKMVKSKKAASAFIDGMKPHDQAFLVKFSDTADIVSDFTSDRTSLLQEIEYFSPQRGSALLDAVYKGVEASLKVSECTVMVLLTDSTDSNLEGTGPISKRSREEVIDYVRRNNVQIFAVSLGNNLRTSLSSAEDELQALTKASNGRYYRAPTAAELPVIFETVMRDIRGQARLTYSSPSGAPDGKWHTIEITAPEAPDIRIQYKPGYHAR